MVTKIKKGLRAQLALILTWLLVAVLTAIVIGDQARYQDLSYRYDTLLAEHQQYSQPHGLHQGVVHKQRLRR